VYHLTWHTLRDHFGDDSIQAVHCIGTDNEGKIHTKNTNK